MVPKRPDGHKPLLYRRCGSNRSLSAPEPPSPGAGRAKPDGFGRASGEHWRRDDSSATDPHGRSGARREGGSIGDDAAGRPRCVDPNTLRACQAASADSVIIYPPSRRAGAPTSHSSRCIAGDRDSPVGASGVACSATWPPTEPGCPAPSGTLAPSRAGGCQADREQTTGRRDGREARGHDGGVTDGVSECQDKPNPVRGTNPV